MSIVNALSIIIPVHTVKFSFFVFTHHYYSINVLFYDGYKMLARGIFSNRKNPSRIASCYLKIIGTHNTLRIMCGIKKHCFNETLKFAKDRSL